MTEQEFQNQLAQGNVQPAPASTPDVFDDSPAPVIDSSMEIYQAALEAIRKPKRHLLVAPTFSPKTFPDQIQFVDDGNSKSIYARINNVWVQFAAPKQIACRVRNSTGVNCTTGVMTNLMFDTEDIDTDNMHDLVTQPGRISINTAGYYLVGGQLLWSNASAAGQRLLKIQKTDAINAHDILLVSNTGTPNRGETVGSTIVQCAVGDFLTMFAQQDSGGNLATFADNAREGLSPVFWAIRIF